MAMSSEPFCKHNICFPFVLFSSGNINKHPQVYITIQYILYADYLDVVMLYITKLTIPSNLKSCYKVGPEDDAIQDLYSLVFYLHIHGDGYE